MSQSDAADDVMDDVTSDATDLCAECDAPIPGRREFNYPSERERFCPNCASWRRRNLLARPGYIYETTEACVSRETQAFYRRNCVETEGVKS